MLENACGSNTCAKCARNLHFYCGFTGVHAPRPFLHPSAPFAEFVSFFMRFYRWLVRKLCEILGNYCWLVRKLCEILDNCGWLVRKLREILYNYCWWALLGGRLPRPHFLDLDGAPGNGHFLLQFVVKTDLKPVSVALLGFI